MATDQYLEFGMSGGERTETVSGVGPIIDTIGRSASGFPALKVFLDITAMSGTNAQVDFRVTGIVAGQPYDLKHFILKTAAGRDLLVVQGSPRKVRLEWEVRGINPSVTFSATAFRTDDEFVPDFTLEASLSQIPGWTPVQFRGENLALTNTPRLVHLLPSDWVPLTVATELFLTSADNANTQTVSVFGLDSNFDETVALVILNGQTPVSAGEFIAVNRMVVSVAVTAPDDIYLAAAGTWTLGVPDNLEDAQAFIVGGSQGSQMTRFTVPRNKILVLTGSRSSVDDIMKVVRLDFYVDRPGRAKLKGGTRYVTTNTSPNVFNVPVGIIEVLGQERAAVPSRSTLYMEASNPGAGACCIVFAFEGWLVSTDQIR